LIHFRASFSEADNSLTPSVFSRDLVTSLAWGGNQTSREARALVFRSFSPFSRAQWFDVGCVFGSVSPFPTHGLCLFLLLDGHYDPFLSRITWLCSLSSLNGGTLLHARHVVLFFSFPAGPRTPIWVCHTLISWL